MDGDKRMMIAGIVVIGVLLMGACAWHLTKRRKQSSR
ncbi:LPXTG cell wall anchor domain-containing protein [Streptomyces sp. NPDC048623]